MRIVTFAQRCAKEILRDPLNIAFGLGFPIVILLLLSSIQANVPVDLFEINTLTPGITVFGLSFITLFSASLVAKDRESAFLQRLYTTPLRAYEFVLGYLLPMLPIAIVQAMACYVVSTFFGLHIDRNLLITILGIIPLALLYISIGLLCGSIMSVKQVGGICGAFLTNLSAWLSGVWFDLSLLGETFEKIAKVLPFFHGVQMERALLIGNIQLAAQHMLPVVVYLVPIIIIASVCFLRQMRN